MRWDLLAADPHATLVGFMGVTALTKAVAKLLAGGLDPNTPAAMVQHGGTSAQRVVRATAGTLPQAVAEAGLGPPALFVIGPTVRHAERLDWFSQRPLLGRRVVMFAPQAAIAEKLELSGAELVQLPLSITPAAKLVLGVLPLTDCVLQNPHEVEVLDEERDGTGWGREVVAWCLHPEAARRAHGLGWKRVVQLDPPVSPEQLVTAMIEGRHSSVKRRS